MDLSVAQGSRTGPSHLAPALAVGVVAFALARLALLPGVTFWDTGEFQTVGPVLGTAHPTGFPTYVLLGWLASVLLQPFGDAAFRMNLLSAICLGGRRRRHGRPGPGADPLARHRGRRRPRRSP